MTYTSAQAAKLLRRLNDEYAAMLEREVLNVDAVRPAYSYADAQAAQRDLEEKIRKLKHALNLFNATHVIPEFGITIDEMLVYIPQLTKRKSKLAEMKSKLPKYRVAELGRISNIIDYTYLNYDLSEVEADYARVSDELANAQLALDAINNRDTLELPF